MNGQNIFQDPLGTTLKELHQLPESVDVYGHLYLTRIFIKVQYLNILRLEKVPMQQMQKQFAAQIVAWQMQLWAYWVT